MSRETPGSLLLSPVIDEPNGSVHDFDRPAQVRPLTESSWDSPTNYGSMTTRYLFWMGFPKNSSYLHASVQVDLSI